MCQRYVVPDQAAAESEFAPANAWWKFAPKFNVAPAQNVPAIRLHDSQVEGIMLRWGFIPSWFKGELSGAPKASVSRDSLQSSKIYRLPWLSSQRCILPVAGFYTWQLTPKKYRQPYFVGLTDRSVFGIAAVWDRWVSDADDVIESCSIVRVPANHLLSTLNDADLGMPAILRRQDYSTWLAGTPVAAASALLPYSTDHMHAYPVSPRVNSSSEDDPALIRLAS